MIASAESKNKAEFNLALTYAESIRSIASAESKNDVVSNLAFTQAESTSSLFSLNLVTDAESAIKLPVTVAPYVVVANFAEFSNKSVAIPFEAEKAVCDDPASCILTVLPCNTRLPVVLLIKPFVPL